jgi:hypothetical protein
MYIYILSPVTGNGDSCRIAEKLVRLLFINVEQWLRYMALPCAFVLSTTLHYFKYELRLANSHQRPFKFLKKIIFYLNFVKVF